MNVPKLRFHEFNDEWSYKSLSNYVERITAKNKNNESNLVLTISAQYGLVNQTEFFNKNVSSSDLTGYYLLKNGDFAYNKSYSNGYPWGTIKRLNKYNQGVVSSLYICFRPNTNINSDYLEQYFETNKWYHQISEVSVEGARNHGLLNIAVNDFFSTEHFFPDLEEQFKVAKTLSLLDKKIELQIKKIEDLKLFKLGIAKNVFNSSKANIDLKLKDIALIEKGKQVNGEQLLDNGNYYMLNGGINPSGYLNEYNREENTITISEGGNSCGYVSFNKSKFWCGGHCYSVSPININNQYLYHLLKYHERKLMNLRVGSGLPNIQKKDLENISIKIHSEKDQENISNLLSKYDNKLYFENKKLNKLNNLKKGLLQKMFV